MQFHGFDLSQTTPLLSLSKSLPLLELCVVKECGFTLTSHKAPHLLSKYFPLWKFCVTEECIFTLTSPNPALSVIFSILRVLCHSGIKLHFRLSQAPPLQSLSKCRQWVQCPFGTSPPPSLRSRSRKPDVFQCWGNLRERAFTVRCSGDGCNHSGRRLSNTAITAVRWSRAVNALSLTLPQHCGTRQVFSVCFCL